MSSPDAKTFPEVTLADWRAQVEKELSGASFDKVLVHRTPEGVPIEPLYTEAPPSSDRVRTVALLDGHDEATHSEAAFLVCTRPPPDPEALDDDLDGGADAAMLSFDDDAVLEHALRRPARPRPFFVLDPGRRSPVEALSELTRLAPSASDLRFALACDPLGDVARGRRAGASSKAALEALASAVSFAEAHALHGTTATISTLPYHDAGADVADEIAFALATGAAYLEAVLAAGGVIDAAARRIALRVAIGRDTFVELCKVRALRLGWHKLLTASGARPVRPLVHAVCSSRTLTQRDPWVNMLRVTTQVFAAVLGGADIVTPAAFDRRLGPESALGRRVARNTGLVLRDESFLGKVRDPAGGAYFFETLTDALAREGFRRFQAIEKDGGLASLLESGAVRARLEAAWRERIELVAKRKLPILGVSEFANLDEKLPRRAGDESSNDDAKEASGLPIVHDADPFERLRDRAEALPNAPEALLVTLGSLAESRARAGFAANFFAAGGIRTRETTTDEPATVACVCGTDERYGTEAVARVRALKSVGCRHVLVAGRPGSLEGPLREAGADGFIFVGCDAVALLEDLRNSFS